MMNMTQEQEEFEKFVRRTNGTWADKCLTRGPDGRYNVLQTWNDWVAWQACWLVRDDIEALRPQPQEPVVEVSRNTAKRLVYKWRDSISSNTHWTGLKDADWKSLIDAVLESLRTQSKDRFGEVPITHEELVAIMSGYSLQAVLSDLNNPRFKRWNDKASKILAIIQRNANIVENPDPVLMTSWAHGYEYTQMDKEAEVFADNFSTVPNAAARGFYVGWKLALLHSRKEPVVEVPSVEALAKTLVSEFGTEETGWDKVSAIVVEPMELAKKVHALLQRTAKR